MTRKVLGRGLEALISGSTAAIATEGLGPLQAGVTELSVDSISPNPFQDETQLRCYLTSAGNVHMEIYTLLGQEALNFVVPSFSERQLLNLSTIPSGQYILQVRSANFTVSKRILVGF